MRGVNIPPSSGVVFVYRSADAALGQGLS